MLSIIETVSTLGQQPGRLGPSTIVGSAAFNFLVISGVSIVAVNSPKVSSPTLHFVPIYSSIDKENS